MPKEDERRKELTQKEIEAEKFRTFFSTSVAQVPEAMSRREEEETPPKRGLFGGLFHREKPESETKEPAERGLELPPTGEIVLGDDAEEPQADLELVLEPEEAAAEQPVMPEPKKQTVPATPEKAPQEPAKPEAPAPEPVKPAEPEKPAAPAKPAEPTKKEKPENKATAPAPSNETKKQKLDQSAASRSAMEQREDEEMKELKAMLFGKPKAPAKSAPKQTETLPASPLTGLVFAEDKADPEPPKTPAEPEKTPEKPPVTPQPTPRMETAAEPESGKEKTTEIPAFRFFGKADDEVKAPTRETAPGPDDSMSLPLIGLDNEGNPSEEPPVEALKAAPAAEASTAEVPVDGTPAAEAEPAKRGGSRHPGRGRRKAAQDGRSPYIALCAGRYPGRGTAPLWTGGRRASGSAGSAGPCSGPGGVLCRQPAVPGGGHGRGGPRAAGRSAGPEKGWTPQQRHHARAGRLCGPAGGGRRPAERPELPDFQLYDPLRHRGHWACLWPCWAAGCSWLP